MSLDKQANYHSLIRDDRFQMALEDWKTLIAKESNIENCNSPEDFQVKKKAIELVKTWFGQIYGTALKDDYIATYANVNDFTRYYN